jgi:hypothetical protein
MPASTGAALLLRAEGLQDTVPGTNSITESTPKATNATLPAATPAATVTPASTVIHTSVKICNAISRSEGCSVFFVGLSESAPVLTRELVEFVIAVSPSEWGLGTRVCGQRSRARGGRRCRRIVGR